MIRIREFMADPEVFLAPEVQTLRPALFRMFVVCFFATDGAGRFVADAALLRGVLYAHTLHQVSRGDVQGMLVALHEAGLVRLYTEEGVGYGKICDKYWRQRDTNRRVLHPDESPAAPPGELFADPGGPPPVSDPPPLPRSDELNRRERNIAPASPPRPAAKAAGGEVLYFSQRLFSTLCQVCGLDEAMMTLPAKRRAQASLRAIAKVKPDLHPDDLVRAASLWRQKFPTITFTPTAMANHWPLLCGSAANAAAGRAPALAIPPEPHYWREFMNDEYPSGKYSRGGEEEGIQWRELPRYARELVWINDAPSAAFARWLRATGRSAA